MTDSPHKSVIDYRLDRVFRVGCGINAHSHLEGQLCLVEVYVREFVLEVVVEVLVFLAGCNEEGT